MIPGRNLRRWPGGDSVGRQGMVMGDNPVQWFMLVAGIGILCWVMMRTRMLRQRSSRPAVITRDLKHNSNARREYDRFSGTQSLGAPKEVLQWQVELYELGRQIQAELESKMVAVQSLVRQQEQAAARLTALLHQSHQAVSAAEKGCLFARVVQLAEQGWDPHKIAAFLAIAPQDVLTILKTEAAQTARPTVPTKTTGQPIRMR